MPPRLDPIQRRIRGAGLDLALTEHGDRSGQTIVLVHGFPDTRAGWAPVSEILSTAFHVVAYDVRGAGQSDAPSGRADYALALLVDDMVAVIDTVSPDDPVHLVGHDWGSIQGWEAVTSEKMAGRIASYTSISGPPIDHAALWMRRHRSSNLADRRAARRQAMHSWYIPFFHLPYLPQVVTAAAWLHRRLSTARPRPKAGASAPSTRIDDFNHGLDLYRANMRPRMRHPTPRHTETPVQIIVPLQDRYITPALLDGLEGWSTLAWRRNVDAGHWVIRTHPDEVAEWVRQLIAFTQDGFETDDLARCRTQ